MTTNSPGDRTIRSLREKLLHARRRALDVLGRSEQELDAAAEEVEAEIEERSQEEAAVPVASGVAERGFAGLREIEGALVRMSKGTYGLCVHCGARIPIVRLRVLPATPFCSDCAAAAAAERAGAIPAPPREPQEAAAERGLTLFPPELADASDAEIAALVREHFGDEVGEALSSVRVLCRHGVITLDGEVASQELRETAVRIIEEEMGLETVDRLWVRPFAREAFLPDAEGREAEAVAGLAAGGEDMYEVLEDEVIDYTPPDRPPPRAG